ncbi:Cdc42 Effector Protein 1 [Manis pentadactyla]|nr:Cdc42 Effector Protein 1 [Manis pentadactyla]
MVRPKLGLVGMGEERITCLGPAAWINSQSQGKRRATKHTISSPSQEPKSKLNKLKSAMEERRKCCHFMSCVLMFVKQLLISLLLSPILV